MLSSSQSALSQPFRWVKQIGTIGLNRGYSVKADNVGNIYVTGSFQAVAQFGGVSATSKGERDVFIAKYSDSGNLIWVKTHGGSGYDEGSSLRLDAEGKHIVVTGFMQNCEFDNTFLKGSPFFVAKYDTSGLIQWVKEVKTTGGGSETSVALDTRGNTFITGGAFGSTVFDTIGIYISFFIAKYDPSGVIKWVRGTHTGSAAAVQPSDIACDLLNNVYVTGFIQNSIIQFDSTHFLTPQAGGNLFLVKYDNEGNVVWAKKSDNMEFAVSNGISIDAKNNIYLTGNFRNKIKFDSIALEGNNKGTAFLAKYDSGGNAQWATKVEGSGYSNGSGSTVDQKGNVYITGVTADVSRFGEIEMARGGMFVAKYESDGKCVFATSAGSIPADLRIWGRDVAVTDSNEIFVTGYMSGSVYFGPINFVNNTGESVFITKISMDDLTGVKRISRNVTAFALHQNYPNPFNPTTRIFYALPEAAVVRLAVFDYLGREVVSLVDEYKNAGYYYTTFDASRLSSGMYFYKIQVGKFSAVKKMVLTK